MSAAIKLSQPHIISYLIITCFKSFQFNSNIIMFFTQITHKWASLNLHISFFFLSDSNCFFKWLILCTYTLHQNFIEIYNNYKTLFLNRILMFFVLFKEYVKEINQNDSINFYVMLFRSVILHFFFLNMF